MVGVTAFDPHAGLVRGDDLGPAQRRNGLVALGPEGALRTAKHVHQPALADGETEKVGERALQPLVGQGLEGLEIGRHGMHARPERRSLRRVWHSRDGQRAAGRATDRQTSMRSIKGLIAGSSIFS